MKPEDLEDVERVTRAAAGDEHAFAELFERHSGIVLGVLTKMLRRPDVAEEVLQEAFLQAWEQAGRYRSGKASPRTWILIIARSRALDRIRSRTSRGKREEAAGKESGLDRPEEAIGTARLEETERAEALTGAMADLPEEQRECIRLAFFEGLTHTELAERLGQPLGTVKSRILLGMRKLKVALAT